MVLSLYIEEVHNLLSCILVYSGTNFLCTYTSKKGDANLYKYGMRGFYPIILKVRQAQSCPVTNWRVQLKLLCMSNLPGREGIGLGGRIGGRTGGLVGRIGGTGLWVGLMGGINVSRNIKKHIMYTSERKV